MKIKSKVVTVVTAKFSDEEVNLMISLGRHCLRPENSITDALVEVFGYDQGHQMAQILINLAEGFAPKNNA